MTVDFETKCEQTALDYIKIHLQEGYLVTAYKDVGNYYWESVYKIRASLSTNRKTENSSEKPNNSTVSKMEQVDKDINVRSKYEPQSDARKFLGCVCETCKHRDEEWDSEACDGCCENNDHYEAEDEPQTERSE